MNIKKPNSFARYGNDYVAPLTTIDQIVKPSGERYTDKEFELMSNVENVMFGESGGKNLLNPFILKYNGMAQDGDVVKNTLTDTSSLIINIRIYKDVSLSANYINIDYNFTKTSGYNYLYIKHSGASQDLGIWFDISNLEDGKTYTLSFAQNGKDPTVVGGLVWSNFQIEKGDTATDYEPFIKSLKGLTESALNMDLLWTNASPSSAFASQTISLDTSKYKSLLVTILSGVGDGYRTSFLVNKKDSVYYNLFSQFYENGNFYSRRRLIKVLTDSEIMFDNAQQNGEIPNNTVCVPYQIYGVR